MTSDRELRERALDATRSFIVQAPAGSGKTELLIQRYLALLARVDVPEQVIAMTFTRKAAAEMRHRVLSAIEEANEGARPEEPHRLRTFELAEAVVARDRELGWAISVQPSRLRIETLDALNARLAQYLSVLAGGIGDADVLERPTACYATAVRRSLAAFGSDEPVSRDIERVLQAVDGNVARLEDLLASLLPTRDQWLPHVVRLGTAELRALLEQGLQRLISEIIEDVGATLGDTFVEEAAALVTHVTGSGLEPSAAHAVPVDAWRALPSLFLTQSNAWRKQLTVRDGFSADDAALKERCLALIESHRTDDVVRLALVRLRDLPSPHYSDDEWQRLESLRAVLVRLVAELKLVFAEQNATDFIDLALAAQEALGAIDDPSELLLALDHRVQHILVDEFQDTSHSQLRLLRLLTSGWQPGDSRTLFLVGDPMQSIYRFRHADMGLFLQVWANGFESLQIEPIPLQQNFRSAPAVVEWANRTFAGIFPQTDDIGAGAAGFRPCRATRPAAPQQAVHWHVLPHGVPQAELARVTDIIRDEIRAAPNQSIAVLVRSRTHLHGLQQAFRGAGITARAVELEPPRREQIVQDLIALTRAMTHLGDRVAWLSLLRAPWCGLTWSDLQVIASSRSSQAIWVTISDDTVIEALSSDGQRRLRATQRTLAARFRDRWSVPFEQWIEETWLALGGPACLEAAEQASSAERFFDVLAEIASHGDLDDPVTLADAFRDPYGVGDAPTGVGVEIMTIHRAKGLEFDSVILLGLGRRPRPEEPRALYWLERTADDGNEDLLLAPLRATADASEGIATFIRKADAERERAERARLLYVATTRARDRLHLVAAIKPDAGKPPLGSLLEFLWDAIVDERREPAAGDAREPPDDTALVAPLRRLKTLAAAAHDEPPRHSVAVRPEFSWARHSAVQVGTLVHAALQEIGDVGLEPYTADSIEARFPWIRRELLLLGVDETELDRAARRVVEALTRVIADPTGRWLFASHAKAASELPMTIRGPRGLEHIRIDRTFIDEQGCRWIVDFKTSVHEGPDVEDFLDSEAERYKAQLTRYAAAMAAIEQRPIRVGLYFPLLQAFRSWQPDPSGGSVAAGLPGSTR